MIFLCAMMGFWFLLIIALVELFHTLLLYIEVFYFRVKAAVVIACQEIF